MTTKLKLLCALETETRRLQKRIDEARSSDLNSNSPSREWAAVKRASLDLNRAGAALRKGIYA